MDSTEACQDIKDLTNTLLTRVEREVHSISDESIADIENILAEVTATLRAGLNARRPLLQLPVETLQQILEHVAPPLSQTHNHFSPFWRSHAIATSMLSPILHTCRQLRRVAISHTTLWKTVSPASRYQLPALPLGGADIPLITIIDGHDRASLLGHFEAMDISRIQELHVLNLRSFRDRDDVADLHRHFRAARLSLLESLSVSSIISSGEEEPISLDQAPRLKHMVLQSVTFLPQSTFPHLTHLAVADVYLHECHTMTADLLSRCPNLESLAINYPHNGRTMAVPKPFSRPLTFNRLRRIALQLPQFLNSLTEFYISLFPMSTRPQNVPIALQIQHHHFEDQSLHFGTLLVHATKGAASHLSLSMTPVPNHSNSDQVLFAISAAGPQGTFHVTSTPFYDGRLSGDWDVLHGSFVNSVLDGGVHLAAVREVWITGRHPETDRHEHIAAAFRTTIAALPSLETIVFVVPTVPGIRPAGPNLGLCPNALDRRGFVPPKLRTLRVVYGDDVPKGGIVDQLNLGRLLAQVETGAYGYFDTLLLAMKPWLVVSRADLQRLKGRFATVKYRHVDRMPTMSVPDYCVEPYAGPGGSSSWLGSLW